MPDMNDHANKCYVSIAEVYNTLADYYHIRTDIQRASLLEALLKVHPADVKPVRHGHWFSHPRSREWQVCSVCHTGTKTGESGAGFTRYMYHYCPHCGAKLEVQI